MYKVLQNCYTENAFCDVGECIQVVWGDDSILRKAVSFLILLIFIFAMFPGAALASEPQFTGTISAQSWMLFDADSGKVLASSDNRDDKIEPASTTKIMTLLVALEKGNMSDEVTISANAASVAGSSCNLKQGAKIKMQNLLTAMMMASGNDAATAVAEHIGGSVDSFVALMNDKAAELGMTNTHFVTPHGLHDENHYTTLNDMQKLASAAMKNQAFMDIVDRSSFVLPENGVEYRNTNMLLRNDSEYKYAYANGMKTGWTDEAGVCLVASASHDGMNLICLLYNYPYEKKNYRWDGAKELFDFGFTNYQTVSLSEIMDKTDPVQVMVQNCSTTDEKGGLLEFTPPVDGVYVTLSRTTAQGLLNGSDTVKVDTVFTAGDSIQAPVQKDQLLGTVTYKSAATGDVIYTGSLIASRDVLQAGMEANVNGDTAVTKLPPMIPEKISEKKDRSGVWIWLLIPAGLIGFLVFRLLTMNRKRRRRLAPRRRPQYSYKIRR